MALAILYYMADHVMPLTITDEGCSDIVVCYEMPDHGHARTEVDLVESPHGVSIKLELVPRSIHSPTALQTTPQATAVKIMSKTVKIGDDIVGQVAVGLLCNLISSRSVRIPQL